MGFLEYFAATSFTGIAFYVFVFVLAIFLNIKVYRID